MDWNMALERLRGDRGNWPTVAQATGLSLFHLRRLAAGVTVSPRIDTAAKIVAYYRRRTKAKEAA